MDYGIIEIDTRKNHKYKVVYDSSKRNKWRPEDYVAYESYQNCCVVFDDMLDSNQKLIDPFFTGGGHNILYVNY